MSWRSVAQHWVMRLLWWVGYPFAEWEAKPSPSVPRTPLGRVPHVILFPACEVCGRVSSGLKTHDGHWRCLDHKGVSCDVCGRAVTLPSLPDQSWRCAAHG